MHFLHRLSLLRLQQTAMGEEEVHEENILRILVSTDNHLGFMVRLFVLVCVLCLCMPVW